MDTWGREEVGNILREEKQSLYLITNLDHIFGYKEVLIVNQDPCLEYLDNNDNIFYLSMNKEVLRSNKW